MAPSSKLAIAIVPGSFSPFAFYVSSISKLYTAGFTAVQFISYPSIGRKDPSPAATMADDAAYIHSELEKLADGGYDILVNAHSYGGVPTSDALKGLSKNQREAEGKQGGVMQVILTAALTPPVGKSIGDVMGSGDSNEEPALAPYVRVEGDYMNLEPVQCANLNFSGLPHDEAVKRAEMMSEHSAASFGGQVTYPGYKDVPVTYILTSKDQTCTPELQKQQIQYMRDTGAEVQVIEIPTDHFPYVTATEEVTNAIIKAAKSI